MIPLAALKKDIDFYKNLGSLVEVLKAIAVSQYQLLEKKLRTYEDFFVLLNSFFDNLDLSNYAHPFISQSDRPAGIIAITSDVGLLGGLNMQVVMGALNEFEQGPAKLIVVGEKGHTFLQQRKVPFVAFPGIKDEERFSQSMQLRDYLVKNVLAGTIGAVKVIYPRPISFTAQRVEMMSLLPYVKVTDESEERVVMDPQNIIMESHPVELAEFLVYMWAGHKMYEILGWSRLAELSARFVHLENSSQKITEEVGKLRLQYFRAKHELIDRSMRELFSARSLYAS